MTAKELIAVGGPNDAGKTTFADEYVSHRGVNYVYNSGNQLQDVAVGTATVFSIRAQSYSHNSNT